MVPEANSSASHGPTLGYAVLPAARPIAAPERIEVIDVLRGFALLGILLVNMTWFGNPFTDVVAGNWPWTAWSRLCRRIPLAQCGFTSGLLIWQSLRRPRPARV